MNSVTAKIVGLVAAILNEREVVLNVGERNGVEYGMCFIICGESDYEIKDPETGEALGTLTREKIRVKIIEVKEKFSIARTYRVHRKNVGGSANMRPLFGMFDLPKYIEVPETFRVGEDTEYVDYLEPKESIAHVGDRVRQVIEDGNNER